MDLASQRMLSPLTPSETHGLTETIQMHYHEQLLQNVTSSSQGTTICSYRKNKKISLKVKCHQKFYHKTFLPWTDATALNAIPASHTGDYATHD